MLHMLDTPIKGRDRQFDNFGYVEGGINQYWRALRPMPVAFAQRLAPDDDPRAIKLDDQRHQRIDRLLATAGQSDRHDAHGIPRLQPCRHQRVSHR